MDRLQGWIRPAALKPASKVILVHGLWMPAVAMTLLAKRLEAEHFAPQLFDFPGRGPMRQNAQALVRLLRSFEEPVHVVAHSLGGLLVLKALESNPSLKISSAVFLACPVLGSKCGRRLACHSFGRWMLGDSQPLWQERAEAVWESAAPLGVIAGAAPWGLGRLLERLPAPNDGVVCLKETSVVGMSDRLIMQTNHSGMLFSRAVAAQVVAFMRWRRFNPQ